MKPDLDPAVAEILAKTVAQHKAEIERLRAQLEDDPFTPTLLDTIVAALIARGAVAGMLSLFLGLMRLFAGA